MKANRTNEIEGIEITLSREKTPVAFKNKLDELMEQKAFDTEDEAIRWIESNPIYVEMIYEKHHGLFLVESEAVESGGLCSPYTKEEIETGDEPDEVREFFEDIMSTDKNKFLNLFK